jgi:hypothetical protein
MSEFLGEDPDRFWADTVDGQQISGRQGEKLVVRGDAVRCEFSTRDLAER